MPQRRMEKHMIKGILRVKRSVGRVSDRIRPGLQALPARPAAAATATRFGARGACTSSATRLVKHKLMEVMRVREDDRLLDGRVEIDDADLGGERSGGKRGRGSENKVPFVAAVQ